MPIDRHLIDSVVGVCLDDEADGNEDTSVKGVANMQDIVLKEEVNVHSNIGHYVLNLSR